MSQNDHTTLAPYTPSSDLAPHDPSVLEQIGQIANHYAARGAVADYLSRKSANTIRAHAAGLARFADFLDTAGEGAGAGQLGKAIRQFAEAVASWGADSTSAPDVTVWQGVTFGLVEAFRNWLAGEGEAVSTINLRLSAVKTFCKLATKAGVIAPQENALIRMVSGYTAKEAKRLNERRPVTRRGWKKAEHTHLEAGQAKRLKAQPSTPQGRRDAVLMCLLLDHGLRCGEVAGLKVSDVDLKAGELRFYRPKVDLTQTHKLSADTLRALQAWFDAGDAPVMADAPLLRGSRKGGALTGPGMSEASITARVRALGQDIGMESLSAHDCRHYWATFWAAKVDVLRLQEAGGWSSLAMPRRYVENAKIANEGMA